MRNLQAVHPLVHILLYALLIDLLIFLLMGIIYLLAGWQTVHQYGSGLVWFSGIGVILLLIGASWRNGRREEWVSLSQIMREHEVFYLLNRDNDGRARFMFGGLIALAITLAIGVILLRVP